METTGKIEEAVMPFKIQQLAEIIMEKKKVGFTDALHYLYSSDFYPELLSGEYKIKHFDGATKEWLEYVFNNRKNTVTETYDMVIMCPAGKILNYKYHENHVHIPDHRI